MTGIFFYDLPPSLRAYIVGAAGAIKKQGYWFFYRAPSRKFMLENTFTSCNGKKMTFSIRTSAPGSMMLLGEHAVLQGYSALVAAHQARLHVKLEACTEGQKVISEGYGTLDLKDLYVPPQFTFVKAAFVKACDLYEGCADRSFKLSITSEFSDQLGFGSSAAVVASVLGAFYALHHQSDEIPESDLHDLWRAGRDVIQNVQGLGSGADVAASLWGGILLFDPRTEQHQHVAHTLPLVAVYSGAKRKTVEVVHHVKMHFDAFPDLQKTLYEVSEVCVKEGGRALHTHNLAHFGALLNIGQGFMESYGVNTPLLHDLVTKLRAQPTILGAKISGSGLGDCVIGLGTLDLASHADFAPYPVFPFQASEKGLILEFA